VALLQKKVMNGLGLARNGVRELARVSKRAAIGEDRRQIAQIDRGPARRVVGLEKPEALVSPLVGTIAQQVYGGVTPTRLNWSRYMLSKFSAWISSVTWPPMVQPVSVVTRGSVRSALSE
jgi:hypothetical protein